MTISFYRDRQRDIPVWQGPTTRMTRRKPVRARRPEKTPTPEDWVIQASCREDDPDALFVQGAQQRRAATICRPCPVQRHCLAMSLDNREEFGVWGGLTERQRRALLRKHTDVESWVDYLTAGDSLNDI